MALSFEGEEYFLNCEWIIYCEQSQPRKAAKQTGKKGSSTPPLNVLGKFDSINKFWPLWNGIPQPHALPAGAKIKVFRRGIVPKKSGPQNQKGGRISFQVKKTGSDMNWLNTVLEVIGENVTTSASVVSSRLFFVFDAFL